MMSDEAMAVPIYAGTFLAAQDKKVHDLAWGSWGNYLCEPQNAWLSK
jgi:hypothetical protein